MPPLRPFLRAWLTDTMRSFGLLTRVPVPGRWFRGFDGRYDRATRAFPLVGVALGLGIGLVALLALAIGLSPFVSAILAVATGIVATGALHEDGLADTADGLGARERERRLEIMRDSATGTYGVLALVLAVGLQVAALAALLHHPLAALLALVAAFALARAAMVWLWHATPPARTDGAAAASGRPVAASVRLAFILAVLAALPATLVVGPWPALVALGGLVAVLLVVRRIARGLGGHTGDVLGASVVLGQAAVLVGLSIGAPAAPPSSAAIGGLAPVPTLPDMRSR